jgi:protein-disulfide isomerase
VPKDDDARRLEFAVTFDYRCPFARNVHEHVVAGLRGGAPWEVAFLPFSLHQVHVGEGEPDVWEDPARRPDLLATEAALAVRDGWGEAFPQVHEGLFRARHDAGRDLRDRAVVEEVVAGAGLDPAEVMAVVDSGAPRRTYRSEHELAAQRYGVFGVPTIVSNGHAAFVRLMSRPRSVDDARDTVERLVALVEGYPDLNELKHTKIPR